MPFTRKMAVAMTATITVAVIGTAVIAAARLRTKNSGIFVRNVNVWTRKKARKNALVVHVVLLLGSKMAIVTILTITALVDGMGAIAVASAVSYISTRTATKRQVASVKTQMLRLTRTAMASVASLGSRAINDVMMKTTTVPVDGIRATAADRMAISGNVYTAKSVSAETPRTLRSSRITSAKARSNAGRKNSLAMIAAMTKTTTAVAGGTAETAVVIPPTNGSLVIAVIVSASIPHSWRSTSVILKKENHTKEPAEPSCM